LTPVSGTPQTQSADGAPARDALIERLTAHAGQAALADADKIEAVSAALGSMAKTLFKQL
ncbi:hypothetical protein XPU_3799, partial [Xanthomonas arboricola pv. pruni str. MAFF 311562]